LPFVLLGCAWWQRGSIVRKDLVRSIPFFALSGLLGLVTIWFQYNVAIGDDVVRTGGFFSRLAAAGWAVWFSLYKAIIPYKLCFVYPRWNIDTSSIVSYLPGIILLGCFIVFWRYRKGWGRVFLFALGYFVVTLFPVLGFFDINFMRFSLVTDHWQYFSIVGTIALVVGLGVWIRNRCSGQLRHLVTIAGTAVVLLFCVQTWIHCHAYKDLEALWRDTISKNPGAWMAHSNLGTVLVSQGRFEEAITHCSEALRINPGHAWIHGAMGAALAGQHRFEEAITHFSEALRIDPDFRDAHQAHNDLGIALNKISRFEQAIRHFSEAVRIKPDFAEAHANLGIGLARKGKLHEAVTHLSEALRIAPDSAGVHYSLGLALALGGRHEKAMHHFSQAVKIDPDFAEAHFNLGAELASQGSLEEAIDHFSEALRVRPSFAEAKQYMKLALQEIQNRNRVSNSNSGR